MVAVFSLPLSFKVKERHNSPSSDFGGLSRLCQQNQRTVEALGATWHILAQTELVTSAESSSASCRVTLRHPFPGPSVPIPCVPLSAAPRALVLEPGLHLGPRGPFLPSSAPSLSPVLQLVFFLPAQGTEKCWHCQKPCVHYDSPNIPLFLLFC